MNSKQREECLEAMRKQREKMKNNPEAAIEFLIRVGVLDADGTPSKKYYSTQQIREHKIKKLLK